MDRSRSSHGGGPSGGGSSSSSSRSNCAAVAFPQSMNPSAVNCERNAPHHPAPSQIVGSPVNFRKQQPSPLQSPQHLTGPQSPAKKRKSQQVTARQPPALGFSLGNPDGNNNRKTRPATAATSGAAPLSSTATLNAILALHENPDFTQQKYQPRPESAPVETRARKQSALIAPLASTTVSYAFGSPESSTSPSPLSSSSPLVSPSLSGCVGQRQSQRCAGCGAYAEMCMGCFSRFKQQDGAAYKKQIIRSVEVLFAKATARAFTKISAVIVQWLFGIWKQETQRNKHRRAFAVRAVQRQHLHRWFTAWHEFLYKRRIVGAMLYAENQQQVTREKTSEISQLHGEVFAITSQANVQDHVHGDALAKLQQVCATQQQHLLQKNQELVAMRKELQEVKARNAILETQVIDPKELERIKGESVDYKKVAFQLVNALFQNLESQVEQLATSEGRQNLTHVFTKEMVQAIDKPECQAFYNPLVEIASIPMAASATSSSNTQADSSSSNGPTGSSSSFMSYDAPTDRAEKILIQWVNALVQKHGGVDWLPAAPSRMFNLHSSLADGKVLVVLTKILHQAMCRVRPKRPPGVVPSKLDATSVLRENGEDLTEIAMERYLEHMKKEENPEKRVELMIHTIGQAMWLPVGLLNAKDILAGDTEFNFATLAYLFTTCSPCVEDSFYALCSDFKLQLSASKARWREFREAGAAPSSSSSSSTNTSSSVHGSTHTLNSNASTNNGEDSALSMKMKLALAQTLELKRKLDAEDQKAREGHLLWWKSVRIVMRKCFLSYARLARGKAGVLTRLEASSDATGAFAKVPPTSKLHDLELPFEDFAWETKLLQSFLLTIYCDLARIYRGYATRKHGAAANDAVNAADPITLGDFMELLSECRVLDATFTVNDVHAIIRKIDPKQPTLTAHHRALPPVDFLEAIIRVARKKYTHRITLSEAFCLFTDNFILPFAFRADADLFRKQLEAPTIRRLLIQYADEMKDLYGKYAIEDPKKRERAATARKRPRMTAFTFSQCLIDKGIQDVTFNSDKVLALVQKVVRTKREQEHSSSGASSTGIITSTSASGGLAASGFHGGAGGMPAASSSSSSSMGVTEDEELTYEEFEEAMVAIACHKFPDPYISLESRVEKFFACYVRGLRGESANGK